MQTLGAERLFSPAECDLFRRLYHVGKRLIGTYDWWAVDESERLARELRPAFPDRKVVRIAFHDLAIAIQFEPKIEIAARPIDFNFSSVAIAEEATP